VAFPGDTPHSLETTAICTVSHEMQISLFLLDFMAAYFNYCGRCIVHRQWSVYQCPIVKLYVASSQLQLVKWVNLTKSWRLFTLQTEEADDGYTVCSATFQMLEGRGNYFRWGH
jgi:hypothetical protein